MDQKIQLKIEFFELCRLLNKSNLKTNQKTEISFFIETENDSTTLYATTNKKYKVQLISKIAKNRWQACSCTKLALLETKLSDLFDGYSLDKLKVIDLTNLIKLFIFQQVDEL